MNERKLEDIVITESRWQQATREIQDGEFTFAEQVEFHSEHTIRLIGAGILAIDELRDDLHAKNALCKDMFQHTEAADDDAPEKLARLVAHKSLSVAYAQVRNRRLRSRQQFLLQRGFAQTDTSDTLSANTRNKS